MVISPPFLPAPIAGETESAWLLRAMAQPTARALGVEACEGSFPISSSMVWHSGLHLVAPHEHGLFLPVRAVADAKVIFVRQPEKPSTAPDHALNYTPNGIVEWSDNGCVILKHSTDIGAANGVPVTFTYYSLTMHLSAIEPGIKKDASVYRKDILGKAGKSYGHPSCIHFEICCEPAELKKLLNRELTWIELENEAAPTKNGRTDCVYGDTVIYLPASTAIAHQNPRDPHRAVPGTQTKLNIAQWVVLKYEKGDLSIRSLDRMGRPIGVPQTVVGAEYDLYKTACELHARSSHPGTPNSPSGWYELLRFGRNLGPDPLPTDAANWQQIPTATGVVWADLNYPDTCKFSEADFLTVMGWKIVNDDSDHLDQRAQSLQMRRLIQDPTPNSPAREEPKHLNSRLGLPEVIAKLKNVMFYFPTDWDSATIERRMGWAKDGKNTEVQVSDKKWAAFLKHCELMCMPDLPDEYKRAMWRINPITFIETMRKCSWLSIGELAQCLPRKSLSDPNLKWSVALSRAEEHSTHLNQLFTKYLGSSKTRIAHALAQIYIETGILRIVSEGREPNNSVSGAFYGRGYMQLTWVINYERYGIFKSIPSNHAGTYLDRRITKDSLHNFDAKRTHARWYPRYDPKLVSENLYHAAESSGFYWVSKHFSGLENINRACDLEFNTLTVGFVCWLVNGGGNGYPERQQFAKYLENVLFDAPPISVRTEFTYPPMSPGKTPIFCRTFPPNQVVNSIKGHVDHDRQIA
jgi:predicted chitinase